MSNTLVSIIIPCYNATGFVGEAIDSALAQTYPYVEVIVIDDGSTDNTIEVLKSYDDRIRWETGPNRGACAARNRGVELAQGEWVQFLDADDCLKRNKLTVQVPYAIEHWDSVVFCEYDRLDPDMPQSPVPERLAGDSSDSVTFVLNRPDLQISSPLHSRSRLIELGGFREHLTCCQDHDLHLRLACTGVKFKKLEQSLFVHRRRHRSLSSDLSRVLLQWPDVYWYSYDLLRENDRLSDCRAEAFSARMAADARSLLRLGFRDAAFENLAAAKKMHPSGGLAGAYCGPSRLMHRILGPSLTEDLVQVKRRLFKNVSVSKRVCRKD